MIIIIGGFAPRAYKPDAEHQRIIRKLQQYGIKSSGSKTVDKAKLHEIELREAQKENCVTSKFLTVTKAEQEKIQEKKKEKREELNPELQLNSEKAQKLLGEQLFLVVQMNSKEKEDLKKKLEKKKKDEI